MKLYLASSWRNPQQPAVLETLRANGYQVYDFRNPAPGNTGFKWSAIDPEWKGWNPAEFRASLFHSVAQDGFDLDFSAMQNADAGVLLLPSGRSAHIEAGYFVGANKPLIILLTEPQEPELMYLMGTVCISIAEALNALANARERLEATQSSVLSPQTSPLIL
ncbi:MAG TPA: hypothetical protein VM680_18475 [Verrucomicrobiae bacterium]|nr:hypothetical protein [Verrucomicrobiae bacterium]